MVLLLEAGANFHTIKDSKQRLPIEMTNDEQTKSRLLSAIQRTKGHQNHEVKQRIMHAHLLSNKLWQSVRNQVNPRCEKCHRYMDRCEELKTDQYVRWLYVHDRIPK